MPSKAEGQKTRIVDAFLGRLATTPYDRIELTDIAADAGVSLSELRGVFDSRLAILEAFNQRIDAAVLDRDDPAMADEPARDRVFDVLMRRLDALSGHKAAVRSLHDSVRRDPMLALAVNPMVVRSMQFMLASARIPTGGAMGRLRAQGLVLAWARIVPVWLDDTDPGLARTMVAVDRELQRGERMLGLAGRLCGVACRVARMGGRGRRPPPRTGEEDLVAGEGI